MNTPVIETSPKFKNEIPRLNTISKLLPVLKSNKLKNKNNWYVGFRFEKFPNIWCIRYKKDNKIYFMNNKTGKLFSQKGFDDYNIFKIFSQDYIIGINYKPESHTIIFNESGQEVELLSGFYSTDYQELKDYGFGQFIVVKLIDKKFKETKEMVYLKNTNIKFEMKNFSTHVTKFLKCINKGQAFIVMSGIGKNNTEIEFCFNPQTRRFYKFENNLPGERISLENDQLVF